MILSCHDSVAALVDLLVKISAIRVCNVLDAVFRCVTSPWNLLEGMFILILNHLYFKSHTFKIVRGLRPNSTALFSPESGSHDSVLP